MGSEAYEVQLSFRFSRAHRERAKPYLVQWKPTWLIILSRSARPGPHLVELEQAGCQVRAVGCDVSDGAQVAWGLQSCAEMGRLRGVIEGAMVLQVAH